MALSNSNVPKILRIAVIQGGKVIEERHIRKRDTVTVGQGSKNTFVIPASNLPPSFAVFELKGGSYQLRFTEAMTGQLAVGENKLDFQALKTQAFVKREKDVWVVPLTDSSKGRISLGEVTLIFQFAVPPPEAPRPVLPDIAKGSLWHTLDKVFFGILAGVLLVNYSAVGGLSRLPAKAPPEVTLEELPDRFVKMIIPEKPKEAPVVAEVAQGGEDKGDKNEGEDKPKSNGKPKTPSGPVDAEARRAEIAKGVASKGLLKQLGALGGGMGSGGIEDVLGAGSASSDIASALSGAGGVGIATSEALAGGGRRGGGTGEATGIGDLATEGGAGSSGKLGEKKVAAVTGRVIAEEVEVDSQDCDRNLISRSVKGKIKSIQACYERELKRNPSLKGKVVVRFTIGETGRVSEVEIEEDSLRNDQVVACIRSTIRMWTFPIKDTECPVAYPFVFAPASGR